MNETTGVDYLLPWQLNEPIEGLGGIGVIEEVHGIECEWFFENYSSLI